MIIPFRGRRPIVAADAFIAPDATIIGDVEIGPGASIWYNCVLRGDVNFIRVGPGTNIQDGSVVHVTRKRHGTVIGAHCMIGHKALIHGCTLQDGCFVGMGATVMDACVVETGAMVAAGALLTPGKVVPGGQLWGGNPAKFMRPLTPEEQAYTREAAAHYAELGREHMGALKNADPL